MVRCWPPRLPRPAPCRLPPIPTPPRSSSGATRPRPNRPSERPAAPDLPFGACGTLAASSPGTSPGGLEARMGMERLADTRAGAPLMGMQRARPSIEILSGDSADVYFARAERILEAEGRDPLVTMEVFTRRDAVLCGIDEAKNLLGHVLADADPVETCPKRSTTAIASPRRRSSSDPGALPPVRPLRDGLPRDARPIDRLGDGRQQMCGGREARTGDQLRCAPRPPGHHRRARLRLDRRRLRGRVDVRGGATRRPESTGTMPHSLVLIFGDTVDAALAFDRHIDRDVPRIVLIDTFKDRRKRHCGSPMRSAIGCTASASTRRRSRAA